MRILLLTLTLVFAGELEVEGDLNVTGNIDSPTIDALEGMKPSRIYRHIQPSDGSTFTFTVPENKMWRIEFWGGAMSCSQSWIHVNGATVAFSDVIQPPCNSCQTHTNRSNYTPITLIAGDIISNNIVDPCPFTRGGLTIYEYSISSSGTDQGMDYIEP